MCDEGRVPKASNKGNCAQRYTVMRKQPPNEPLVAQDQRHPVVPQDISCGVAKDEIAPRWMTIRPHDHSICANLFSGAHQHFARLVVSVVLSEFGLNAVAFEEMDHLIRW